MIYLIRKNCWESNSSSTHALCISKDKPKIYPDRVNFVPGYYGWEFKIYRDIESRASYLYTAMLCLCNDIEKEKNRIYEILGKNCIECDFQNPKKDEWGLEDYGIDHVDELSQWLYGVLAHESNLLRWLFGDSVVVTGNDNSDEFTSYLYGKDCWDDAYWKIRDDLTDKKVFIKRN